MIVHRPFESLGAFQTDWLTARYHFSFGDYHDPTRMGLGALRVWNDDSIEPGRGFDLHGHRDMEIVTYVREGAITHQDHLGNHGRTEAGNVQIMSAGKGILHSEYNREEVATKIYQIWIQPRETGLQPRWDTRRFPEAGRAGGLVPLASGRAAGGETLTIHQDATVYAASLLSGQDLRHLLPPNGKAYLVPAKGRLSVNGQGLSAGDGLAVSGEEAITIKAESDSELLMVETI